MAYHFSHFLRLVNNLARGYRSGPVAFPCSAVQDNRHIGKCGTVPREKSHPVAQPRAGDVRTHKFLCVYFVVELRPVGVNYGTTLVCSNPQKNISVAATFSIFTYECGKISIEALSCTYYTSLRCTVHLPLHIEKGFNCTVMPTTSNSVSMIPMYYGA